MSIDTYNSIARQETTQSFYAHDKTLGSLAAQTIGLTPPDGSVNTLAIVLGLGEERLAPAIERWRNDMNLTTFLIAGVNQIEPSAYLVSPERLRERLSEEGRENNNGVQILPDARHTKDQTDWFAEVLPRSADGVQLVAPTYHVPRLYATTVRSFMRNDLEQPLVTLPIDYAIDHVTPDKRYEEDQTQSFMATKEAERIRLYQQKGDVASDEEWQAALETSQLSLRLR